MYTSKTPPLNVQRGLWSAYNLLQTSPCIKHTANMEFTSICQHHSFKSGTGIIYTSLANIGRTIRVTTNIIQSVGQAYYSANTQKQLTWLEQGRHHFASRQLVPTLSNWFTKCTKSLTLTFFFYRKKKEGIKFFNEMQPKFFGSMDQLPHNSKCVHRVDGEKNYLTKKWRSRKCKNLTFEKGFKTRNIQFLHVLGHHFFVKYVFFPQRFNWVLQSLFFFFIDCPG